MDRSRKRPPGMEAGFLRRLAVGLLVAGLLVGAAVVIAPPLRFWLLRRDVRTSRGEDRTVALSRLLRAGAPGLVPILLDEVRWAAGRNRYLDALMHRLEERHVPLLLDRVRGEDPRRRSAAAFVLTEAWGRPYVGRSEDVHAALPAIWAGLIDGLSPGAPAQDYIDAIRRLRREHPPTGIEGPLLAALRSDRTQDRENALRVVYYLRGEGGILDDEQVRDEILRSLEASDASVRLNAALILEGHARAGEASSLAAASGDADPRVREIACNALGDVGGDTAIDALIERMGDRDQAVREVAIVALGRLRVERVIPLLIEMLEESRTVVLPGTGDRVVNPFPARAAAKALGHFEEGQGAAALREAAREAERHPLVRIEAMRSLGRIGDEGAVPAVAEALDDEDREVRVAAIRALGRLGGRRAAEALVASLRRLAETGGGGGEPARIGEALRKVAGVDHGPREGDGPEAVAAAIEAWEEWMRSASPPGGGREG